MNKFTFYPVGQGLFYAGQLNYFPWLPQHNFVFDCGGEKSYVQKAVREFCKENCHINLCVISHLHKDHYNGLIYLKNEGITFDEIFLPYLPKNSDFRNLKTVYIVGQYFKHLPNVTADDDDIASLNLMLSLYGITDGDELRHKVHIIENGNQKNSSFYSEYQNILPTYDNKWIYEIYNKSITDEKWNLFNDKLNAYLKKENIDNVFSLFPDNIAKLVEIYKAVFGANINATSIVMKHYFNEKTHGYYPATYKFFPVDDRYCSVICPFAYERRNKNVSVLTGDAEFDEYLRKRIFNEYSSISVLQIPHHGAKSNWNKLRLPKDTECKLVASFGLGNQYKHPNTDVVTDILDMFDCEFISVTQSEQYEYWIDNKE